MPDHSSHQPTRPKRRINITSDLPVQNYYTLALNGEFSDFAFDEVRAPLMKGQWRNLVFKKAEGPLDLEVGTGNGTFFAHQAHSQPERLLLGIELKYKPLIQTIRRALKNNSTNAAVIRYHAFNIEDLFEVGELDNVYIHFPDPWTSPLKPKNRFVCKANLEIMHRLQKPGSFIQFKTDSLAYFEWALEEIKDSPYEVVFQTFDLHNSEIKDSNFETAFEKIFLREKIKINYIKLLKK